MFSSLCQKKTTWLLLAVSLKTVSAGTYALLVAGQETYYHSVICRVRRLLLTQDVPAANIITFGPSSLKNLPTFPDQRLPSTNCEADYTASDSRTIDSTFFLNILKNNYDEGFSVPKTITSTANDDIFMYFAGDTGYDSVSLPSGVLYGRELWKEIIESNSTQFRAMRIVVDGSVMGSTFLQNEITAANSGWSLGDSNSKNVRVVSNSIGNDAATNTLGVLCNCPLENEACMSTKFGLSFTENEGSTFAAHLANVRQADGLNDSISEIEYGVWTENANGKYASTCSGSAHSQCTSQWTSFLWAQADLLQSSSEASYDSASCNTLALDGRLQELYFRFISAGGLHLATFKEWIDAREDFKSKIDAVFSILTKAPTDPSTLLTQIGSACPGTNGLNCRTETGLATKIGTPTDSQAACVKELTDVAIKYFGMHSYVLDAWTLPAAHLCASSPFSTSRTELVSHVNETFCGCPPVVVEEKKTYYAVTFWLGMFGVVSSFLGYGFFHFFDTMKNAVRSDKIGPTDKERAAAAAKQLLAK